MLYGYNVVTGDKPIDRFLYHIDCNYVDFNPRDERCRVALGRFYAGVPSDGQLVVDIRESVQCEELKGKLLMMVQGGLSAPAANDGFKVRVIMDGKEYYYNPVTRMMKRDGVIKSPKDFSDWAWRHRVVEAPFCQEIRKRAQIPG